MVHLLYVSLIGLGVNFGCAAVTRPLRPHDVTKAAIGRGPNNTYPACHRLSALFSLQAEEEKRAYNVENTYQTWLDAGQLHCGVGRAGWGLFDKMHNEQWVEGCVPEILPAKRRLLEYMQQLCRDQAEANANYHHSTSKKEAAKSRGVIYTGKSEHFKDIYQSIMGLRFIEVSLPVEVWVNSRDMGVCETIFHATSNGGSRCKRLPDEVSGFASKFYALLSTKLRQVLFVDADNLVTRDVNEVFDSPEFQNTGAVIWPDLWGEACRSLVVYGQTNGMTGYSTHVFWMAKFGGLTWDLNNRDKAQESEAGQIAYDLDRHSGLLELGRKFIEDKRFLKRVVNGDKDIFRFVHLMMGEPFSYAPHFPGYSVAEKPGYGRDCLTQYWGSQNTSPMFFHQLKVRDPDAFLLAKRIDPSMRSHASACVDLSVRPGLKPLVIEKHSDGEKLRIWAQKLFTHVDTHWHEQGLDTIVRNHEWRVFVAAQTHRFSFTILLITLVVYCWLRRSSLLTFFRGQVAARLKR